MKFTYLINKAFSFIEYYRHKRRLNICKTIYVNLRSFPLPIGIKFPVFVYGSCKIISLKGQMKIEGIIKKGMIKIGASDPIRSLKTRSIIQNDGIIKFGNNIVLRRGISLGCQKNSFINIGDNTYVSDNVTIIAHQSITIGNNVLIGYNSIFMDTDYHYLLNINSLEVKNYKKAIVIGNNNWIGSWTTIKKGVITPDHTIVAGPNSMLNKDYTTKIKPFSIIGGSPAKLIAEGFRLVNNLHSQHLIDRHFQTSEDLFVLSDTDIDNFCLPEN